MLKKIEELFKTGKIEANKTAEIEAIKELMTDLLIRKTKNHLKATFQLLLEFDSHKQYSSIVTKEENIKKIFITSNTYPSYVHLKEIIELFTPIEVKEFDDVGHLLPILKQEVYYKLIDEFVQKD